MPTSATFAVFLAAKPQQKPIPKPNEIWAGAPDSIKLWYDRSHRHATQIGNTHGAGIIDKYFAGIVDLPKMKM